jgi:hypothetical protein
MKKGTWVNHSTRSEVYILKTTKTQVHVEYINSGMKCWYMINTFKELFQEVK